MRGEADPAHETATALRSQSAAHRRSGMDSGEEALSVEVVVAARTPRESGSRSRTLAETGPNPIPRSSRSWAASKQRVQRRIAPEKRVRRQLSRAGGGGRGDSDRIERRAGEAPAGIPGAREHVEKADAAR